VARVQRLPPRGGKVEVGKHPAGLQRDLFRLVVPDGETYTTPYRRSDYRRSEESPTFGIPTFGCHTDARNNRRSAADRSFQAHVPWFNVQMEMSPAFCR
jgi:hypothetical protein